MWARGVRWFGLAPRQAWTITLTEYGALAEAHEEMERRRDFRAWVVGAPWGVKMDLFPSLMAAMQEEQEEVSDAEYMRTLVLALGGRVIEPAEA